MRRCRTLFETHTKESELAMEKALKTMRRSGAWAIVMGSVICATGVAVGVGCIIMGAQLRHHSH